MAPLISICIPAYKNKSFLDRLLDSVRIQTFKDFEVILTDDSPDNELEALCREYSHEFPLRYYKNDKPLGTPANWNYAISKANGEWIKLMHDDDWFVDEKSLQHFAVAALRNAQESFIFSGYIEKEKAVIKKRYLISTFELFLLKRSPLNLFKKNFVGHPSTTLVKNNRQEWYDERIRWVVDFEFYIRCLRKHKFIAIKKKLIYVGLNEQQVTKKVFRNLQVELVENFYLLNKLGKSCLKNVFVYDYFWRLFRNLNIRGVNQINCYVSADKVSNEIKQMLSFQKKIPTQILKIGLFSKFLMLISKTRHGFLHET